MQVCALQCVQVRARGEVTLGMVRVVTGCCWWCTAHGCSHGGTECCVLEVASLASSRYSTACSVHTVQYSSVQPCSVHYTTLHYNS